MVRRRKRKSPTEAFDWEATVPEGGRDDALYRAACSLRAQDVSDNEALERLRKYNAEKILPPMPDSTVRAKLKSAYKNPPGKSPGYQDGGSRPVHSFPRGGGQYGAVTPTVLDLSKADETPLPEPLDLDPGMQVRAALMALFKTRDLIAIADNPFSKSTEPYSDALQRADAIGGIDLPDGMYVVVNPLNGEDRTDNSVTDYKNLLVECDPPEAEWESMGEDQRRAELERQTRRLIACNLPIRTLTYSGNRSIHAVVAVDAKDKAEYDERAAFVYKVLEDSGFTDLDPHTKNASRWTRLAGPSRNGTPQRLIATGTGAANWEEWTEWVADNATPAPEEGPEEDAPVCRARRDRKKWYDPNGRFKHNRMVRYLIREEHARFIGGVFVYWDRDRGHYIAGTRRLEWHLGEMDDTLSRHQRGEVLGLLMTKNDPISNLYMEPGDPELIAFANGVLNIKTGEFGENRPELNIPVTIPHDYDPSAECPELDAALDAWSCNDPRGKQAMVDTAALCLYRGDEVPQAVLLSQGSKSTTGPDENDGSNGKSTFITLLKNMVGSENMSALALDNVGGRFSSRMLEGVLVNIGDDIPPNRPMKNGMGTFKNAVTHNTVEGEIKNGPNFFFTPFCHFVFACNGTPLLNDTTGGMYRRWTAIEFKAKFPDGGPRWKGKAVVLGPKGTARLIRLAVEALPAVIERGGITPTRGGRRLVRTMFFRGEDVDPVLNWARDVWPEKTGFDLHRIPVKNAYEEFKAWHEQYGGEAEKCPGQAAFSQTLCGAFAMEVRPTTPKDPFGEDRTDGKGKKTVRCFTDTDATPGRVRDFCTSDNT